MAYSGDDWKCERGYVRAESRCAAVQVPANGYLDSNGSEWRCDRGFKREDSSCIALAVPAKGYLDYSGTNGAVKTAIGAWALPAPWTSSRAYSRLRMSSPLSMGDEIGFVTSPMKPAARARSAVANS